MAITIPYSFTDGQTIVAAQHNANFNAIASFVDALQAGTNFNTGAIGTTDIADDAVTGPKIAANAVGLSELASAVANALVPTGTITAFGGSVAPTGWLVCDGSNQSRTTYSDLFTAIGTNYGSGDGSTTFGLPNLKGRVAVGFDSTQTEFDVLGETGGAKTHTLVTGEIPAHSHADTATWTMSTGTVSVNIDHGHTAITGTLNSAHAHALPDVRQGPSSSAHNGSTTIAAGFSGTGTVNLNTGSAGSEHTHDVQVYDYNGTKSGSASITGTVAITPVNTGGGGAHNNLQPYQVVNYIIKI